MDLVQSQKLAHEISGLYPRTTPEQIREIVYALKPVAFERYDKILSEVKKQKSVVSIGSAEIAAAIDASQEVRPISHEVIIEKWREEAVPREKVAEFFGKLAKEFRGTK